MIYYAILAFVLVGLALLAVIRFRRPRHPTPWRRNNSRTLERELLLEPNKFSDAKIEHYALGLEFILKLGKPCALVGETYPDVAFRCQVFSANVPCPNFVRLASFTVANVIGICTGAASDRRSPEQKKQESELPIPIVACSGGAIDLWHFREPKALVDLPTAAPANAFRFNGLYDGKIPEGYKEGDTYRLSIMLAGPASITA